MLTVAYYFLQVCLCSTVMMCYYALVLRNKRFHQYNRFYLLSVAVLPWLVPLVKIDINQPDETPTLPIQLFAVIADANTELEKTVASKGFQLTWDAAAALVYITISTLFLLTLLVALVKIYRLLQQNSCKRLDDVFLVLTQANGTPFSFFKFIFWNTDIDVTTHTGKQMLQHELTHVHEKHSVDKLLLQLVIIVGWFNPIFWLLKRELETIHEFIADNKTIQNGDTATLATMLLTAAYPQQKFALTNPFFYSPIKRRIAMLTNNKNPKFSYARRVVVLPLLLAITLLFAFRKKEDKPVTISVASAIENVVSSLSSNTAVAGDFSADFKPVMLKKTYTVVIDAGHGGTDGGSSSIDGKSQEKDIVLSISKLIKAMNKNANITIVLTRDNDATMSPPQKVEAANKANPDLFVSLHCNAKASAVELNGRGKDNPMEGVEIIIANKQKAKNYTANYDFAAYLKNSLLPLNSNSKGILTRQKGIWVLQEVNCPSVLIECGYMDVANDLKKLQTTSHQQILATNILKGIEAYLGNKEKGVNAVVVDTVPKMKGKVEGVIIEGKDTMSLNGNFNFPKRTFLVLDDKVVLTQLNKQKNGSLITVDDTVIIKPIAYDDIKSNAIIDYKKNRISKSELGRLINEFGLNRFSFSICYGNFYVKRFGVDAKQGVVLAKLYGPEPLFIVDGKKMPKLKMNDLNPTQIQSINVLKDTTAISKYGDEGKNGVMEIILKKDVNDTKPLLIVDGKKMPELKIDELNPTQIKSINVLKDKPATDKYGEEGKNGVLDIILKKDVNDTMPKPYK